jgi:hypothetical protein
MMSVEVVGETVVWTRRRWRWRGIEAHAEKRACDVNPTTVGEAVGDSPAWTRWRSRR